jgi:hypothetical protein
MSDAKINKIVHHLFFLINLLVFFKLKARTTFSGNAGGINL